MSSEPVQLLDRVAIRFAGDSGDRDEGQAPVIHLHDGEPVRVGADQVVARGDSGELMVVAAEGADQSRVVTHHVDADDPYAASALSRLDDPSMAHVPMVLFRNVSQPTYDDLVRGQVDGAGADAGGRPTDTDLTTMLYGKHTWTVGSDRPRHRPRTGHATRHGIRRWRLCLWTLLVCGAVLAVRREFAWCRSKFENEDVWSPVELRRRPVDGQATLTKSSNLLLNQGTTRKRNH